MFNIWTPKYSAIAKIQHRLQQYLGILNIERTHRIVFFEYYESSEIINIFEFF